MSESGILIFCWVATSFNTSSETFDLWVKSQRGVGIKLHAYALDRYAHGEPLPKDIVEAMADR
jgi:hypothetical protein